MTRYLMIAFACLFLVLVACGDAVTTPKPQPKSYMGKVTFGPSHKGAVKAAKATCVKIKGTGKIVRLHEWRLMKPRPELEIETLFKCGGN
jgi:hypothetical protein